MKLYKKKKGKDVRKDNRAVQKLRREVEKAKRALSSQQTTRVEIESFYDGDDFSETLTRAKFEELNMVCSFLQTSVDDCKPLPAACRFMFVRFFTETFQIHIETSKDCAR